MAKSLEAQLGSAARAGKLEEVKRLIAQGADPNRKNSKGWSAIILAASKDKASVVEFLLTQDINPEDVIRAIHIAAQGSVNTLGVLLASGKVDIDDCPNDMRTPLFRACEGGHLVTAQILVDAGADVSVSHVCGITPLHEVAGLKEREHAKLVDLARNLIARGADLNAQNSVKSTPLHVAVKVGNAALAELLVAEGTDTELEDEHGKRAVDYARSKNMREVLSGKKADTKIPASKKTARKVSGALLEKAWHAYAGNFFEGVWAGNDAIGEALCTWAEEAFPEYAEDADGDYLNWEVMIRDEEGIDQLAKWLSQLPENVFYEAISKLCSAIEDQDATTASRLRKLCDSGSMKSRRSRM